MTSEKEQHHLYKYYVEPQAVNDITRRTLVLVLAGGEGSRLKNLTKWRAKPAVPFGGKYRIIDFALSNCINSGLRRIGVLTQYKSHSLIRHLQRAWGFMRPEIGEFVEIIPAQQRLRPEWYQGTADAIYQNLDIVYRHEPDYVLILGGDHIYTMNYAKMLAAHVQAGAELTIGCIEVRWKRPRLRRHVGRRGLPHHPLHREAGRPRAGSRASPVTRWLRWASTSSRWST
jgi:glucose-1-phosphate adenylyltransferase